MYQQSKHNLNMFCLAFIEFSDFLKIFVVFFLHCLDRFCNDYELYIFTFYK